MIALSDSPPTWALERLIAHAASRVKVRERSPRGAGTDAEPSVEIVGGEPPVPLDGEGLEFWDGRRMVMKLEHPNEVDRSGTLWWIAMFLRDENASEAQIEAGVRDRDVALGYRKYADRRDADVRYAEIARDVWAGGTPRVHLKPKEAADDVQTEPEVEVEPRSLDEVLATFQRWLYLPDPTPLYIVLGAVAANYLKGDPLWLMLIGAASSGKTELLAACLRLPHLFMAATLTEAALLSGTPRRERNRDAKGGLLRVIGSFGVLLCKDFTSVLSMNRDARAALLAALREIYDGKWTRHVGVDGGRTLAWQGKLGLLAGSTSTIDSHHAVTAAMGERFVYCRLAEVEAERQGRRALDNAGHEAEMRQALSLAVSGLFATLDLSQELAPLGEDETTRLVALASLVARARSAVERDGRTREIELILDSEAPARLAQALRRLYGGMRIVGVDPLTAWQCVVHSGLDCLPKLRRGVFDTLTHASGWASTSDVATRLGYPTGTTRRALEDLAVHGVAERESGGEGKTDRWRLSDWARERYGVATGTA